ncbi:MAG: PIG-L family deacetylase [Acidobacteria bacterium]|nr:PIG-L family deacetylase [Acidobacteriota bacterium]
MRLLILLILTLAAQARTVLVVTADASDFLLAAGGTIASMTARGDTAILLRVTNDEKNSWDLSPDETARRNGLECAEAAKLLGIGKVVSLGYREGELGGVSPTELRDRIMFYIRLHKPDVLFLPNPHAEYVEVLDRHYAGLAAEEASHTAALRNHQPPFAQVGLETHVTRELYYYAQPFDPRRREPESTATFVPQPKVSDIGAMLDRKIRAALALKTINHAVAMRIRDRLESTGRRLPLLDTVNDASVAKLTEINVRTLAGTGAKGTGFQSAEEFHYAGPDFGVPSKFRK